MRALDFSTDALIRVVDDRFEQVRRVCDPASDRFPTILLYRALLPYARLFVTNDRLSSIMGEARARYAAQWDELLAFRSEHEPRIKDIAQRLKGIAVLLSDEQELEHGIWSVFDEVINHPGINQELLRPLFSRVRPSAVDHAEEFRQARLMADEYNRVTHLERAHLERQALLNYAHPFYGSMLVGDLGRSPDTRHDLRTDPSAFFVGRFLLQAEKLADTQWTRDQLPYGLTARDVWFVASAFHDWVIERLLEQDVALVLLNRYRQRLEQFLRAETIAELTAVKGNRRSNADELAVRRKLNLYLHDHGLDPVPEPELGVARPDAIVNPAPRRGAAAGLVVTYEAKVIRPGDASAVVRARLRQGVEQATRYAHAAGLPVGHLVVFWNNNATPNLAPRHANGGVVVHLVLADLRGGPYEGSRQRNSKTVSFP